MNKIIIFSILLLLFAYSSDASEITGNISTNQNGLATSSPSIIDEQDNGGNENVKEREAPVGSGLLPILLSQNQKKNTSSVKVLGLSTYPDRTLLRGSKGRIYIVAGTIKKHLKNLKELKKYRGQTIYDVTDQELSAYPDRPYIDGDLIRQKGTAVIYVIVKNKKQKISSLTELRAQYIGLEIFNVNKEDMSWY